MAIKPVKVSQLNSYIKRILQLDPLLSNVSVIGEVSNLKKHGSGHIYFTMKDESSKINCFLSSDIISNINFEIAEGMEITAAGYIYIYERGGTYSLNIRDIQIEGLGNLSIAFEKLKTKLASEGLFDEKFKKKIPSFPKNIAVITSETGAAVNDIIKIVKNRNNIVNLLVYPVLVQGPNAANEIANAILDVNKRYPYFDTIITGRGGGSLEELWAFNEEIVARSIFKSKIPVISAVGHETDFTISDFVADKRAETPTAAAQMAVPDITELKIYTDSIMENIHNKIINKFKYYDMYLLQNNIKQIKSRLLDKIENHHLRVEHLQKETSNLYENILKNNINKIEINKQIIESLNPDNFFKRGYVALKDEKGYIKKSISDFKISETITAVLIDGEVDLQVINLRGEKNV